MRITNIDGKWDVTKGIGCQIRLLVEPSQAFLDRQASNSFPEPRPPLSTHTGQIISADLGTEKPLKVRRVWEDRNFDYDCYISEELALLWQADKLHTGDIVVVEFLNQDELSPIATLKVHRT